MKVLSRSTVIILCVVILAPAVFSRPAVAGNPETAALLKYAVIGILAYGFYKVVRYEIFDAAPGRNYSEADSSILAYNYIFSSDNRRAFKKIEDRTQRIAFVDSFWEEYDLGPYQSPEPLRREFEGRIAKANKEFSNPFMRGWRTDQGRITIIYGPPEEVLLVELPALTVINNQQLFDGKIEIWYYDRQRGQKELPGILRQHDDGRMFFVFADQSGNGIIRQVFSTELYEF